jgi:parvulin-like peptidyl-prolyl isomerase
MKRFFSGIILALMVSSGAVQAAEPASEPTDDVIAKVGDQTITFSEINTMLNSSAVVGISIPALGTPERDTVRIALLDKVVSANLLYLDALKKGVDQDPEYQRDMTRFSNAILADLYYRRKLVGDIEVSDDEVQAFFKETIAPGTELTDEVRTGIEATLRKRKLEARQAAARQKLREGADITIYQKNIEPAGDDTRADSVPVVEVGGETIRWGDVKDRLVAAGKAATRRDPLAMEFDARLAALQGEIDLRLLAQKARAAGMESDPAYQARVNEYRKTRLINLHRANLAREMAPDEKSLQAYFEKNRDQITVPEFRKVQMVSVKTRAEAEDIKAKIEAGQMTMYQAAADYSIAPDARQDLGEVGWVAKGKARPELDAVIFALGPGEIGGPVEAAGNWHLVTVLDVKEPQYEDLDDEQTRRYVRRKYVHEKLDAYVVDLRKHEFPVVVYEDKLVQLAQQEADMVKQLAEKAQEPGSVTQERLKELQKIFKP